MKLASAKSKVIMLVLLSGVLPALISFAVLFLMGETQHVQEPVHEWFELTGRYLALAVAMLLLLRSRYDKSSPHLLWVVAALVAMGLMDGFHSVLPFGIAWSWLRHTPTLIGGLLFAMVWCPLPKVVIQRNYFFTGMVAVLAMAWSFFVTWQPDLFPAPFLPGGYHISVKIANGLGGLGFLVGAMFFIRRYLYEQKTEDMAFAIQMLIFGSASLLFGFSHVWAADWWVWHIARLVAYSVVLIVVYKMLSNLYQNITSQMQEMQSLGKNIIESEERFRAVFDNAGEGIVLADLNNKKFRTGNNTFCRLIGYNSEEILNLGIMDIHPEKDLPYVLEQFERQARGEIEQARGLPVKRKDGTVFYADITATFITIAGERYLVGFFHDVTEQKRAEEALKNVQADLENRVRERTNELKEKYDELTKGQTAMLYMIEDLNRQAKEIGDAQDRVVRSEKMATIGQLASSVAHELRNPLGVMKNAVYYLNMLELGKDNADIKENMDIISGEIENSDKIISDLLEFSRIKKPDLESEEIGLIIKETLNRLRAPSNIKMIAELDEKLPQVRVDALQMQQVFLNLASNAIQAMEVGGTLLIRTALKDGFVEVSFADTGTGISKENLAKIFEPLFSTKAKGTGLGLSVVASLVEGHGGKIGVESERGKGSTFTMKLPIK